MMDLIDTHEVPAPKATIYNAAFLKVSATAEQIDVLLDICRKHGASYWNSANHFLSYSNSDTNIIFHDKKVGLDGRDSGLNDDQVLVTFEEFSTLLREHYGEVIKNLDEMPVRNPRPRYRQRKRQKPQVAKTIVRVLYVTQQTYTFKNVRSVQIIDDKVFIQYQREITEGIIENAEVEIDGKLVMAVVIHEVGNRSNFFRNIDGSWDFQADNGTVINNGKQLGRIFKQ